MNMAIVGYGNVGKSSLGYYFAHKKFSKDIEPTEHQQYYNRTVTLQTNGSLKVKVNIADTPPFDKWAAITQGPIKSSCVLFILFDTTKRKSFEKLVDLIEKCEEINQNHGVVKYLVGTKSDIQPREVLQEEA